MEFHAEGICKRFGEKQVLKNVSLSAKSGAATGILGRNGAGKTTTIRIIMGVFPPDSGTVYLDGKPIRRETVNFGYLPEERGLYPKKSVMSQLIYLAQLRGVTRGDAKQNAMKWLKRLEMDQYANKQLITLSKGNQQKIQLAAALVTNPDFLILDEPFSGLDPVNAMLLEDVVKECIAAGKLVFFSSHQMNYIEEFCDQINILNGGEIVLSGSISEIKRSYERNRLVVKSGAAEGIAAFLRGQGELIQSVNEEKEGLLVTMRDESCKAGVLSALTAQSFDLDEVRVWEPSLNDIFVQYTEDRV